jgi:hypothetical protein
MSFDARTALYRIGLVAALVVTFLMASGSGFARSSRRTDLNLKALDKRIVELYLSGRLVEATPLFESS